MGGATELAVLQEILTWIKVSSFSQVKTMLLEVLDSTKKRKAYQLTDGGATIDFVRKECAMSPNSLLKLYQLCVQVGLMEVDSNGKRRRLFDLEHFGLLVEGSADDGG